MSKLVRKNYPQLGEVKAPYVHAVKHNNTLYISGLTAFGTAAQQSGMAEQAEAIFNQMTQIVSAEGTDFSALIKVTIFITSFEAIDELRTCCTDISAITCQPARWSKSAAFSLPILR